MCKAGMTMMALFFGMGMMTLSLADNDLLKDPTAPQEGLELNKPRDQIKNFHLTAIFISGDERHAVINNSVVKKGDKIADKMVQAIDPYTVTLLENGKERTLYLLGSDISVKGQAQ